MEYVVHRTFEMRVWVYVDEGIADIVMYLNTIPGVHTTSCCQGTIGEGGAYPYAPYVMVTWATDAAEARLRREFDFDPELGGDHWGTLHPKAAEAAEGDGHDREALD